MKKYLGIGILVVLAMVLPYGLDSYKIHVANVAIIFAILAVGLFLTMGIAGQINLAQVAFFGTGAYVSAILTTQTGLGFWPAAAFAVGAAILIGLIVGIPALRMQSHYLGIVTLGLALAFTNLVTNSPFTGQAEGINNVPGPTLPGVDLSSEYVYYYLEAVALVMAILLAAFVVHTPLGRRLRAMRDDDLAASAMGAEVPVLRMAAFAFGGLYGGVAGVLYSGLIQFVASGVVQPGEHVLSACHGHHRWSPQPMGCLGRGGGADRDAGGTSRLRHLRPARLRRPGRLHGGVRPDRLGRSPVAVEAHAAQAWIGQLRQHPCRGIRPRPVTERRYARAGPERTERR